MLVLTNSGVNSALFALRETSCVGGRHNMHPPPVTLTFDLLTLKVMSESRVTWGTSVPILVFLGLSVLDLGLMYATDRRQTDVRQHNRLMPLPRVGSIITLRRLH